MFKPFYKRLISKIALVAVVFASLAPTISHAIEAQKGNQTLWQEVCSAQGIKLIPSAFVAINDKASKENNSQPKQNGHAL